MTTEDPGRDDRLSELLRRAVPDGPDPAGRAGDVVRRARRGTQRRGVASVAAVGIVALAVVAGPSLVDAVGGSSGESSAAHRADDTSAQAAALTHPVVCPVAGSAAAWLSKPTDRSVPDGAVLARVCSDGSGVGRWTAPIDALTTNVDSVIAAFNALPPAKPADFVCAVHTGRTTSFTLSIQYADGRVVALDGYTGTCNGVQISGGPGLGRVGAAELLATFVASLQSQRAAAVPPAGASKQPLECPARIDVARDGLLPGPWRVDMKKAVLCTYFQAREPRRIPLTASEVAAINADYRRHPSSVQRVCQGLPFMPTLIIGVTDWGDNVSLNREGCGAWSRGGHTWTPGTAAQEALDAALSR